MLYLESASRRAIQYLCLLIAAVVLSIASNAEATTIIPQAQQPYGSDRVTTSDGASCESAVASGTTFSAGIAKSQNNSHYNQYQSDDSMIYAQINVPIDFSGRKRVDCSKLYNLELERVKQELMKLKLENQMLKQGGIDWGN